MRYAVWDAGPVRLLEMAEDGVANRLYPWREGVRRRVSVSTGEATLAR